MKRFITVIFLLCLCVSLVACGSTPSDGGSTPSGEKEGLVYLCMQLGDLSFNDSGWRGCKESAEKYGLDTFAIELGNDTSTFEAAFLDACDSGKYKYLVTQSNNTLSDLVLKYAPDYPDMKFICFDIAYGTEIPYDNVTGIAYEQNDGSYLAGMLAARLTKSGKVATITGNDVPVLNDFFAGFIDGALSVNPNIKVTVSFTNSWDAAVAKEVTAQMFADDIDVVFALNGSGSWDACNEAGGLEAGKYIIGVDDDQWAMYQNTDDADLAEPIVTSMMKNVGNSIIACFDKFMNGDDSVWGVVELQGIEEGAIDLAYNDHYKEIVSAEVQAEISAARDDIISGKINPKSYFDFANYDEWAKYRDTVA